MSASDPCPLIPFQAPNYKLWLGANTVTQNYSFNCLSFWHSDFITLTFYHSLAYYSLAYHSLSPSVMPAIVPIEPCMAGM